MPTIRAKSAAKAESTALFATVMVKLTADISMLAIKSRPYMRLYAHRRPILQLRKLGRLVDKLRFYAQLFKKFHHFGRGKLFRRLVSAAQKAD